MGSEVATILVSVISTIGGITIAYIVNVASKKVQRDKAKKEPLDRIGELFSGYERLIKQKDIEDERKARIIERLEGEIYETKQTVNRLEQELATSKRELGESQNENSQLKRSLEQMRVEFSTLAEMGAVFKN